MMRSRSHNNFPHSNFPLFNTLWVFHNNFPHSNFPLFNTLCVFHNNFPNIRTPQHNNPPRAMGGATTMPHIKTTYGEEEDEEEDKERERLRKTAHKRAVSFACLKKVDEKADDETVKLRPLKKIESAEGRTIVYEPSNPKDIERWSAEIDYPRRAGLQPWMKLKQLMLLYELHPYDGLAIFFKHLSSTERTQIRYDVEDAIGEDGMRPEKGWDNNTDLDSLDLARKLIDTG
ncbi:unnamed protein product [Boreogadus saida]